MAAREGRHPWMDRTGTRGQARAKLAFLLRKHWVHEPYYAACAVVIFVSGVPKRNTARSVLRWKRVENGSKMQAYGLLCCHAMTYRIERIESTSSDNEDFLEKTDIRVSVSVLAVVVAVLTAVPGQAQQRADAGQDRTTGPMGA